MLKMPRTNPRPRRNPSLPYGWKKIASHPMGPGGSEDIYAFLGTMNIDASVEELDFGPVLVIHTAGYPLYMSATVTHENYPAGKYEGFLGGGLVVVADAPTEEALYGMHPQARMGIHIDIKHGTLEQLLDSTKEAVDLFLAGLALGRGRR